MSAFLLATGAACLFGGLAVAVRVALERGADPETSAAAGAAIGLVVAAVLAAGEWPKAELGDLWPYLIAGAVAPGLSQLMFVRAIEQVGAARTAILFGVSPLLAAVPAVWLLDEPFGLLLGIGTAAIVVGCLALAWERRAARTLTGLGIALSLGAAALIAARDNYARHSAVDSDVAGLTAAAATLAAGVVVLGLAALVRRRGIPGPARPAVLVSGLLQGLAYCALLEALTHGRVTVVVPLYTTESLWAVVFAAVFLGRREAIGGRIVVAAGLMVVGGALIGASG